MSAKNYQGENLASGYALTKKLWEFIYPDDHFDETTELKDIYEADRLQDKVTLERILKEDFTVNFSLCPEWYDQFLSMPWFRIYTLNIDDLVENILDNGTSSRKFKSVSASSSSFNIGDNILEIIHLNGKLDDLPDDVVFSRTCLLYTSPSPRDRG